MIESVFWCLATIVIYVYAGYPLALFLLTRGRDTAPELKGRGQPTVTLLISAYNEEDCIAEKLENSLQLGYPEAGSIIEHFCGP